MDEGRKLDLEDLEKVLNDPERTEWSKTLAYNNKKKILRQLKDKKLTKLRQYLFEARKKGDDATANKLAYLIKDHTKESREW